MAARKKSRKKSPARARKSPAKASRATASSRGARKSGTAAGSSSRKAKKKTGKPASKQKVRKLRRSAANSSRGISSRSTRGSGARRRLSTQKESPGLQELLVLELQEIHNAEKQLARLIPRLASAATSEGLRIAIEERLEEGEQIIADVENGLEELGASPGRKRNVAAEGLGNDLREHVQQIVMGPALDAVLIGGLQKTEHYCIAAWGTVKALAAAAGQEELAGAMERALEQGKAFDAHLTQIADEEVRPALTGAGGDEVEDEVEDDTDEEDEEDEGEDEDEDEDEDGDDGEDEDGDEGEDDDDANPSSRKRRPRMPLDPQPPVGLPEASIEDDAEDKQEEEETRGRGKHRPGRDN